ncbi:hypothetical protein V6N13_018010 [Hibiscus sabdariffa]|uniref:Uncharacterized protein n=1 Tax=Hibiscus sabdariffa TaxID=183260 RepID=A0ABR2CGR9_9ROSI
MDNTLIRSEKEAVINRGQARTYKNLGNEKRQPQVFEQHMSRLRENIKENRLQLKPGRRIVYEMALSTFIKKQYRQAWADDFGRKFKTDLSRIPVTAVGG